MRHVGRGGLVVLVVLAGAACGWAQEKPTPIEGYIPTGPILYVYYQGFAGAGKGFDATALRKIIAEDEVQAFGKELSRFLDEAMREHAGEFPLTWADIRMLLDCEMGFALLDVRAQVPQMVLIIRGDGHIDGVRALQDRLIARAMRDAPPNQPVPEGDMDGIRYKQLGPFYLCWVGGDLVVTSGPGTLRRVVRTLKGLDPSLLQDARFKTVRAKTMGGKEFLMAHFSVETLIEQKTPEGVDAPPRPKWFKAVGADEIASLHLALAPDPPGVKTMLYVHAPRGRGGLLRILQTAPIDEKKALAGVSGDVADFVAARFSAAEAYDALERTLADLGEDGDFKRGVADFREKLGFDFRGDLLATLGDEVLIQSLGPGYLVVPEFFASVGVKDEAALRRHLEKLVTVLADELEKKAAAEPPRGPVRRGPALDVEKLDYKGRQIVAMKFRMAPVPVTPSFVIHDGRLIVGLVPQTVRKALDLQQTPPPRPITESTLYAAVRAHLAPKCSVLAYAEFKQSFAGAWGGLLTHLVQMLNGIPGLPPHSLATRFPSSSAIEPHLFATVQALSHDGEGFLFEGYGPLGGGIGPPGGGGGGGSVASMGIMAGFLLPALAKAQGSARAAASMNNIRQIGLASIQYAGDHDDKFPPSFGVLLQKGYLTTTRVFFHPGSGRRAPPDFPGDFKNADLAKLNEIDQISDYVMVKDITHAADADFIVLYERKAFFKGRRTCFFNDGHTQSVMEEHFQKLLEEQKKKMGEPVLR